MTQRFRRLSHSLYECKYHIVFCPKYRYRIFKEAIGEYAKQQVYQLCKQKEQVEVLELNVQPDHVHLVVTIPPKYAVSEFMGYLKGKMAIRLVPTVRKSGATILGASPVGERLLCEHHWTGRREDPEICPVAGEARKASRGSARKVV